MACSWVKLANPAFIIHCKITKGYLIVNIFRLIHLSIIEVYILQQILSTTVWISLSIHVYTTCISTGSQLAFKHKNASFD